MKAKLITYSRLVNTGNYNNSKIEIQLEVEEGETAYDVFNAAKKFVDQRCDIETIPGYSIENAKRILSDKLNYKLRDIEAAEELIKKLTVEEDNMYF